MNHYAAMSRAELQAAAKAAGLRASGTTKDILARLQTHAANGGIDASMPAALSSAAMDVAAAPMETSDSDAAPATAAAAVGCVAAVSSKRKADAAEETEEEVEEKKKTQRPPAKKSRVGAKGKSTSSPKAVTAPVDVDLTGCTFLIPGDYRKTDRCDIETLIRAHGGVISKTAGKSLNYCVVGSNATASRQYMIASKLDTCTILDEKQLRQLLKDHASTMKRKASVVDPEIRVVLEEMRERLIPDLTSLIAEYASGSRGGWLWQEICTMLKCDEMPPPASESAIAKLEAELNVPLPECLKSLWRIADGMGKTSVHPWLHRFVDTTAGHSYIDANPRENSTRVVLEAMPPTTEAFSLFPSVRDMREARSCSLPFVLDDASAAKNFWSSLDLLPIARHARTGEFACLDRQSEMILHLTPLITDFSATITIGILGSSLECILETYHRLVKAKYEALTDRDPTKTRDELEAEAWATSDGSPYRVTSAELRAGLDADRRRCGPRGHECTAACATHPGSLKKCAALPPARIKSLTSEFTLRMRTSLAGSPGDLASFLSGLYLNDAEPTALVGPDGRARAHNTHCPEGWPY